MFGLKNDGRCDFEENPFYQLTSFQRENDKENGISNLDDYDSISTYLTQLELSFMSFNLEHRNSNDMVGDYEDMKKLATMWEASIKIQRCFRKWSKPRKDAVRKIEEKFLEAYWSPRTEMGRRHINRLYDDNLE